jgi:hypothetical protein
MSETRTIVELLSDPDEAMKIGECIRAITAERDHLRGVVTKIREEMDLNSSLIKYLHPRNFGFFGLKKKAVLFWRDRLGWALQYRHNQYESRANKVLREVAVAAHKIVVVPE